MRQSDPKTSQDRRLSLGRLKTLGVLIVLALLIAPAASASYEQVADFGKGEMLAAAGLAVNTTGAGGMPVGTVYAVSGGGSRRVSRYNPDGEFREAWGWGVGDGSAEFQRCGPDGAVAFPTCKSPSEIPSMLGEGPGQLPNPFGVAVDQGSGRVYVSDQNRKSGVVQVFSGDGSELLESFGEKGVFGESFDEGPGKVHELRPGGIAVDGDVAYLTDWKAPSSASGAEERVMVFEAGVYKGRDHDIAPFPEGAKYIPLQLSTDDAGNLYFNSEEAIYKFAPSERLAPSCEFQFPAGGIGSMTVDPKSGAPFFFSSKGKKEIHQLGACDGAGKFAEVGTIPVSPQTSALGAMAFNPELSYESGRPLGILYGADGAERGAEEKGIGHIFTQPVSHAPEVGGESVSGVGTASALLRAQVNPNGAPTTYRFQYLTEAAYQANDPSDRFAGAAEAPAGGAALGNGLTTLPVSVALSGLEPDTAYRFRVVASNTDGISGGDPDAFRTYPAGLPALPGGRAYERVTPAEKHSGEPFPLNPEIGSCGIECKPGVASEPFPRQVSSDGDGLAYSGFSFSPDEGAAVYNAYLSRRSAAGWQTTNPSPALMSSSFQGYKAFNADLSQGILYQINPALLPSPPSPGEYANLYLQPPATPAALSLLLGTAPANRTPGPTFEIAYAGASADFTRFFFAANDALGGTTPPAVDGGAAKFNLYEYVGGTLRLVNVQPGNATTVPGAFFGSDNESQGESANLSHAISADGSRVFWSSESGQVYVRKDGSSTEEVPSSAKFLTASADGSRLLLANGLIYDVEDFSQAPLDLSEGKGGFVGIAGQSEDLSTVYFIDTAALNIVPNDQGEVAQASQNNLYVWQQGGTATFIATLLDSDSPGGAAPSGTWTASPSNRLAEASSNGGWLAFRSKAALIDDFENVGPCELIEGTPPVFKTSACTQAYLYDAATGTLYCPSCNPSGEAPHGPSTLPLLASRVGQPDPQPQPSYLSDSGRLLFDSQDRLSSRDVNGNVEDVYEFTPQGVGGCARVGGCVALISSGRGPDDSNFLATDAAGLNVFFTSRDRLVPSDVDQLIDVYDARRGGGFAFEDESQPGECQGEGCQPPPPPAPATPIPGSASFHGPGNPKGQSGRACPKGKHQVKVKKGKDKGKKRCVGNRQKKKAKGNEGRAAHNRGAKR